MLHDFKSPVTLGMIQQQGCYGLVFGHFLLWSFSTSNCSFLYQ